MSNNSLFRKKNVQQIMAQAQLADANTDTHALSKHLKLRDLIAFG